MSDNKLSTYHRLVHHRLFI